MFSQPRGHLEDLLLASENFTVTPLAALGLGRSVLVIPEAAIAATSSTTANVAAPAAEGRGVRTLWAG